MTAQPARCQASTIRHSRPGWATRLTLLLVAQLAWLWPSAAHGQSNSAAAPKVYMNQDQIQLPIELDPRLRAELKEVHLFVKTNPQSQWTHAGSVSANHNYFLFAAPADGEYWFTSATLDRFDRFNPPDLTTQAPQRIVVIDRARPQVEVRLLPTVREGVPLQLVLTDANLDRLATSFEYQLNNGTWQTLYQQEASGDIYLIPAQAAHAGRLRIVARDRCGNTTTREMHLQDCVPADPQGLATANFSQNSQGPVQPRIGQVEYKAPVENPAYAVKAPAEPALRMPVGAVPNSSWDSKKVVYTQPMQPQPTQPQPQPAQPQAPVQPAPRQETQPGVGSVAVAPFDYQQMGASKQVVSSPPPSVAAPPTRAVSPLPPTAFQPRQIFKSTRLSLEYQIEEQGPSGVGRVEVWITRDQSRSWQKIAEDSNCRSPVTVDLPGEGVYGIFFTVSNGRGFGAAAPAPGEVPTYVVEVDQTAPKCDLTAVTPVNSEAPGTVQIAWHAHDVNLRRDPIDLFYAMRREGPWYPIAQGLANTGSHRWAVPQQVGGELFVRLQVTDLAGNVAACETERPIAVDDLSRPRARVLGATSTTPVSVVPVPGRH